MGGGSSRVYKAGNTIKLLCFTGSLKVQNGAALGDCADCKKPAIPANIA
jgi:hypothetical protein